MIRQLKRTVTSMCILIAMSATASAADAVPQETTRDLALFEAYLDGVMAAQFRDYQLAGMTFALVMDGELVFSKGYGYAHVASKTPVDPAVHLFRPGSVSKLFTWTAVMQLVEQGKLDLNTDVGEYVDQFEIPNEFDQPLTLSHIMTHSPGLEDGAAGYLFADEVEDLVPLADSLAAHIPNQIWQPGTYSAYSNWATAVAGLAVANVSGMPFERYIASNIFEPLGMLHATFDEPLPEHLVADFAQGYTTKNGGLEPFGFEFIKNFGPAGALSASAEDMARFMIAHASGDTRILQKATMEQMHSRLFAHHPSVAGMAHGFYEIRRNGERFIGHGGDTIAFHSELVIQPETEFGFFLSFNAAEGATARTAVTDSVLDYFYPGDGGALPALPAAPLAGSAERIAKIVGAYRLNRRSYTKLEGVAGLAGDLTFAPGEEGEIVLPIPRLGGRFIEVAPFEFRKQGRQELLVFDTDDAGNVTRAFIGSLPIMVADKVPLLEQAGNHQLIIALALLASLFVIINAVRNRGTHTTQAATVGVARQALVGTSVANLLFAAGLAVVVAGADLEVLIFDFPPPGTGLVLVLPLLSALLSIVCVALIVPVWRAAECNLWQRLRFTYTTLVFALFVLVLWYWHLLGWNY